MKGGGAVYRVNNEGLMTWGGGLNIILDHITILEKSGDNFFLILFWTNHFFLNSS